MIITKIYKSLIWAMAALLVVSCSNLDESAFDIQQNENADILFSETFGDGLGEFVVKNDNGPQTWAYYSNGYAIISGYENSVNNANDDWLISPEIDLTNVPNAYLTFDHVGRYFADINSEATVLVAENYDPKNETNSIEWKKLKTEPFSNADNWTFGSTEQISLTSYAGKKIRIAFRYQSTSTKAGTWELKNVVVKKGVAVVNSATIYSESFGSSLGQFSAYSVTGDEKWYVTNGYAYMTGYVSSTNKANEDWLISPEIDLSNQSAANFSFDHVTRYFANLSTEATVQISENYITGTRPDSATWTKVATSPFVDPGTWTFSNSQKLSLTTYCGKKVHIAFKYISTASKAGSWELKNFKVYSGEANGTDFLPYTVKEVVSAQTGGLGWVEGYVVGYSWPKTSQYYHFFAADTCTQTANVLLADTTAGLYSSRCISVQLPRGGIRNGLNLKSNAALFGQKIKIYGNFSANNGIAGLVNPTKYILPNGTVGLASDAYFSIPFTSGLGTFTTLNVNGPQVWGSSPVYGATMSGYSGSNVANEDWLISPEIDLTNIGSAAITFEHAINKGLVANVKADHTLWISTNNGTSWEQITNMVYPVGNTWTYISAGEIVIDKYVGHKVKIAFKYISTTSSSATWEIKNFKVY